MSLTREQRRMAAMATLEAARTGGQLPAEIWASAQRKDDELIELATAYKDSRKQEVLENIVLTLAALESLARPYTVVYQPPTDGTPVPAPAAPQPAPATPTPPSSGTRQGAPSQATPPVSPTPVPSPAPASDDSVAPAWFTAGIVPLANQVNDHETRIKRLEKGGFDWLVAAVVAIVVALVTFVVMTKGDFGDPVKVLASLAIGIFTGLLVEGTRVGIKSRRSSRNAA